MIEKNTSRKKAQREPSGYKNVTYNDYTLYLIINAFQFQTSNFKLEYHIMYISDINVNIPTFIIAWLAEHFDLTVP